ncbi:hypothetical protein G7054_g7708 [Neopestalotiopsis clavispora]|nr:hypothetical protein G7054_g7708 [Neopestalotiopsis clavispora]
MHNSMKAFENALETLKEFINQAENVPCHNDRRLRVPEYLEPTLQHCHRTVSLIQGFLNAGFFKRHATGARFDRKVKSAFKVLADAKTLFVLVVHMDTNAASIRTERLVEDVSREAKMISAMLKNEGDRVKAWLSMHSKDRETKFQNNSHHERNIQSRKEGSCGWLAQNATFQSWHSDNENYSAIWVRGSPGTGKTVLCSHAIRLVQESGKCAAYYFYAFDRPSESTSDALAAACLLVEQIFDYVSTRDDLVKEAALDLVEDTPPTQDKLDSFIRFVLNYMQERFSASTNTKLIVPGSPIRIFLDGLDEQTESQADLAVLDFLLKLTQEFPGTVKLWISSRNNIDLCEMFDTDSIIQLPVRKWINIQLQNRANGCFLFAKLMVDELSKGTVFTHKKIVDFIQTNLPNSLNQTYSRIFEKHYSQEYSLASKLFSMVAFAQRPLRLQELLEAIAMLSSGGLMLDLREMPMNLDQMLPPLIELRQNLGDPQNPFCHLSHATVRDFLIENPTILCEVGTNSDAAKISREKVLDVCLRYLSQDQYSKLFASPEVEGDDASYPQRPPWADAIENHHFLKYAAKYWNHHLNEIPGSEEMKNRVLNFLCSPNFQTLLQIQNLAIASQSAHYQQSRTANGDTLQFPKWLDSLTEATSLGPQNDFRHFASEWSYFLGCDSCEGDDCDISHFRGDVSRCLTGMLGPKSALKGMKEKHESFVLCQDTFHVRREKASLVDGIASDGSKALVISSISREDSKRGRTRLNMESWAPRGSELPVCSYQTSLIIEEIDTNWPLYTRKILETRKRFGRPQPMAFTDNLDYLRIGSQLYEKDAKGDYQVKNLKSLNIDLMEYFEEFASKGRIVVLTRRQKRLQSDVFSTGINEHQIEDFANTINKWTHASKTPGTSGTSQVSMTAESDGESSSDDQSEPFEYESSTYQSENSAEDTSSESSTVLEMDIESLSGSEADSPSQHSASSSEKESESEGEDSSRDEIILSTHQLIRDLSDYAGGWPKEDPPDDISFTSHSFTSTDSDNSDNWIPPLMSFYGANEQIGKPYTAAIAILDLSGDEPRKLFHFNYGLPVMLYNSPPAIHPTQTLAAWPLSGGCIRPQDTGQPLKPSVEPSKGAETKKRLAAIAVFITTYRLSASKTTRSPPVLINRVRLSLGTFRAFSLSRLPVTFTWTERYLYLTLSSHRLQVFRVTLFRPSNVGDSTLVWVPRKIVFLPFSARRREVQYFPPTTDDGRGLVLIGTHRNSTLARVEMSRENGSNDRHTHHQHSSPYPCPPVGLHLHEEEDLGGWLPSKDVTRIVNQYRDGRLVTRMDDFDTEDDFDLESFMT